MGTILTQKIAMETSPNQPVSPQDATHTTPQQYLAYVKKIDNIHSLNSLKERLVNARRDRLVDEESYNAIWKEMHRKARELGAAWNTYRKRFMLND